jgi:hypothetical protein
MSDFTFEAYGVSQNEGKQKSTVDYEALNAYVVETVGCQQPEVLIGTIVGIVDVGVQKQEDAQIVFTGTEQEEADIIATKPDTYFTEGFDNGKPVRLKCYPQRNQQSVALVVDFPSVMLNKGQFFKAGSTEEKPLRMVLGGEYWNSTLKQKLMQRPTALKVMKDVNGRWSFNDKHLLYKMAIAAKLIEPKGVFLPEHIGKLLGKSFQFEVQIHNKAGKDGKSYYTEKVNFKAGLGRGMTAEPLPTEPFVVQFNKENSVESLKELRFHVVNTIKNAVNYAGSPISRQLDAVRGATKPAESDDDDTPDDVPSTPPVKAPVRTPRVAKAIPAGDDDDKSPF